MMQPRSPALMWRVLQWPVRWACACALLASIAAAQAPARDDTAPSKLEADQEPITPIPRPPSADPLKLALGERLYGDVRLSAKGNFACSSCHDLQGNGASGNRGATTRDGSKSGLDTLTVFNASLNFRLGWRGTFRTLADQTEASIQNPANMDSRVADIVRKLSADPDINSQFRSTYGQSPDRDNFLDALTTFERSLVTPDSRFDRWLESDASALSPDELKGYRLFKALGCSSCHQGANVGGNLLERQGIFHPLVPGEPTVVRVPSLRNVATTAPYFHDGSAATLEDAVRRMSSAQLDRTLNDQQVALLVLFLKTLTGNYRGSPVAGGTP